MESQRVKFIISTLDYPNGDAFLDVEVHFTPQSSNWLKFEVFPINQWYDADGKTGWSYNNKHDSNDHDTFSAEESKMLFHGTYCWRGVWESRIYLPDGEEYWGYEFVDMARILKDWIAPWCKNWLKKQQPQYKMIDFEHGIDRKDNNSGK